MSGALANSSIGAKPVEVKKPEVKKVVKKVAVKKPVAKKVKKTTKAE